MEMTGVDRLFLDTNILIYATNGRSPWHGTALEAIDRGRQAGARLFVSTQVLREYLAAATRIDGVLTLPIINGSIWPDRGTRPRRRHA